MVRIRTIAIGAVATMSAIVMATISWLLWPLPDPALDWRAAFDQHVEDGDCWAAASELMTAIEFEPFVVVEILDSEWLTIQCADVEGTASRPELETILREMANEQDPLRFDKPAASAFHAALTEWALLREYRLGVGMPPFALSDLELSFRCWPLFASSPATKWYAIRNARFVLIDDASLLIPKWERRLRRCRHLWEAFREDIENAAREYGLLADHLLWILQHREGKLLPLDFARDE